MKTLYKFLILSVLIAPPMTYAGAVMDMVVMNASGKETGRSKIFAQSNMIRMDIVESGQNSGSMIFLGDQLMYLDHAEKSYIVLDEAMLENVSAKINEAMAEMEKQLAGMPPEQRAMVEQMMKGRMQGMMPDKTASKPAVEIKPIGSGEWQSEDCEKFAVFEGGRKTQEVCAADLDGIDGADEVMQAFRGMAQYVVKMSEALPMMAVDGLNPGELMDRIDGFPVHSIEYENGKVVEQSSLESVTEKNLEPGVFAAPDGYREHDPFAGR